MFDKSLRSPSFRILSYSERQLGFLRLLNFFKTLHCKFREIRGVLDFVFTVGRISLLRLLKLLSNNESPQSSSVRVFFRAVWHGPLQIINHLADTVSSSNLCLISYTGYITRSSNWRMCVYSLFFQRYLKRITWAKRCNCTNLKTDFSLIKWSYTIEILTLLHPSESMEITAILYLESSLYWNIKRRANIDVSWHVIFRKW